ncbi:MAG: hypothetical protein MR983_02160 [Succinatimonas sp.]|nr:hypothetical protein [Succinatimonas sp.]
MDAQNTEIEIDLVRLFKFILSKWKVLLVSGVILSVLAFSYKFYGFNYSKVPLAQINELFDIERLEKQPDGRVVKQKVKVSYELYKKDYESRLSAYENEKKSILTEIKGLERRLSTETEYTENSLLYTLDNDEYYESEYFIDIQERNKSGSSSVLSVPANASSTQGNNNSSISSNTAESKVISLASKLVSSQSELDELSSQLGIAHKQSLKAVSELINLNSDDGRTIDITVKANNEKNLALLEGFVSKLVTELKDEMGDQFIIKSKKVSSGVVNGDDIQNLKNSEDLLITSLQSQLTQKNDAISALVQPVPLEDKFIELSSYKIQKYIIFILAGLFGGIFISSCVYGGKYLFEGKLRDKNYLKDLYNLRLLGCLHESCYSQVSTAEKDKFTELVKILVQGTKTIAVSSSLAENTIEDTVSIIRDVALNHNVEVKVITDKTMSEITNCDGVIVVEKLDVSDLNKALDNLEVLKGFNVNLLGLALA